MFKNETYEESATIVLANVNISFKKNMTLVLIYSSVQLQKKTIPLVHVTLWSVFLACPVVQEGPTPPLLSAAPSCLAWPNRAGACRV